MVLGYWAPGRIRRRQHLGAARTADRYSPEMTVLATGATPEVGPQRIKAKELEAAMVATDSASTPVVAPLDRSALLALRAVRARRRLRLTLGLLALSALGWLLAGTVGAALLVLGLVPTIALIVVLVLGRMAAVSAKRADARYVARQRALSRQAQGARSLTASRPAMPRTRASLVNEALSTLTASPQVGAVEAAGMSLITAAASGPAVGSRTDIGSEAFRQVSDEADRAVGQSWHAREVPPPVYSTKAPAPVREPRPLTCMTPAATAVSSDGQEGVPETSWSLGTAADVTSTGTAAVAASHAMAATAATVNDDAAVTEPTTTSGLGLPLDQILARRRAS